MATRKLSKPTQQPAYELWYVEWEDHAGSDGWTSLTEATTDNDQSCLCSSVGWLIAENAERITIVSSIGSSSESKPKPDCAGRMTIAKALIKARRVIAFVKSENRARSTVRIEA